MSERVDLSNIRRAPESGPGGSHETNANTATSAELLERSQRLKQPWPYPQQLCIEDAHEGRPWEIKFHLGMSKPPLVAPVFPAGREPLPPSLTEDDRPALDQQQKMQQYMSMAAESCVFKSGMAGAMGFGLGAFFSMMSTSFAYEDPLSRTWQQENITTRQKTVQIFKDMGKGMYKSGKGFGKVGALYSGVECIIEGYRAKNDINNALSAGFISGAILARNSGPRAAIAGGLAFAAFSGAIDLFIRREPADED